MGLLNRLFGKQQDKQEEKPAEYNVMYPKIEVVDSEECKNSWGYDPYGYPEPQEEREEIGVWDIWPKIIRQSYNLLMEKYNNRIYPFNRKYVKYMKWEEPSEEPKFYHLRFTYKDKNCGVFLALQGGSSVSATMERTAYDAFMKGCEDNNMIPLIANGWGTIFEPSENEPYYIRLYDAYTFKKFKL